MDIGIFPSDWSTRTLGEIGQCLIGLTYEPENVRSDGILVLRSSNIEDGNLRFADNVFVSMDVPERIIVRENDLLICVRNGSRSLIGKCALVDRRSAGMTFGAFMSIFRSPYNGFVFYCFQSDHLKRQIHGHLGATINQITNESLSSFQIPYPRKEERDAITEVLADVDGLLAALGALIAKKRAIKQAAMQQLFSGKTRLSGFGGKWPELALGEIGGTYGGLSGKSGSDFGVGDSRYVTFLGVLENVIVDATHTGRVYVASDESQNSVLEGDLLINGTSETPEDLALGSVMGARDDGMYLNSFCFGFRIRDTNRHDPIFLAYLFRSTLGRKIFLPLAQGATRYNLSKARFLSLRVPLPTYDEQCAIVAVLSDLDAQVAAIERNRDKVRAIKQGMMEQLLTGRVRLV